MTTEDRKGVAYQLEQLVGTEALEEFWDALLDATERDTRDIAHPLAVKMQARIVHLVGRRNSQLASKAVAKRDEEGAEALSEEEQRLIDYINGDPVMLQLHDQLVSARIDYGQGVVRRMLRAAIESLTKVETPEPVKPGVRR